MNRDFRHTKIVFTVGPATASEERLEELIRERVDVCRLNMAHASHEWTTEVVTRVRAVSERVKRHIAVMMDVKGPEIRTGDLPEPLMLEAGETFDFLMRGIIPDDLQGGIRGVTVNYPKLNEDVQVGGTLLVDSGLVRMKVTDVLEDRVRCKVIIPGPLANRRHINLPGQHVSLPSLTKKDKADIQCGLKLGLDYYALSFVRQADDLDVFRRHLEEHGSRARIIAKIEDQSAITNLEEIITASDGLMVARGDLGIECPYQQLPVIQRRAVKACIENRKPVIVATHMLESMIDAPIPTRAEVSDVANAVFERADAVMLSGETTTGKYPVECVRVMNNIAREIEREQDREGIVKLALKSPKARMLRSAAMLAEDLNAGIIVFSRSGYLPQILSSLRPSFCPIFVFTDDRTIFRQMMLLWGVEPFHMSFQNDPEETIREAFRRLKESQHKWGEDGDWTVIVTTAIAGEKLIDTIQMRQIE